MPTGLELLVFYFHIENPKPSVPGCTCSGSGPNGIVPAPAGHAIWQIAGAMPSFGGDFSAAAWTFLRHFVWNCLGHLMLKINETPKMGHFLQVFRPSYRLLSLSVFVECEKATRTDGDIL